jgi:hypothetical protein
VPQDGSITETKEDQLQVTGTAMAMATARATPQTRYSFTAQFLRGSAIFARRAHEIEKLKDASEELQADHLALVVGAITQAAAALEAEISEVLIHGPGHHLGSNGVNSGARDFLFPLAETIDREPPVRAVSERIESWDGFPNQL